MFPVNCPKTRNEEFGQLLEALTEKYCQTVMKLDELIGQFDTLKDKNDKVIKFQDENFSKHDNGIEDVVAQHRWRKHYEIAFCNISFSILGQVPKVPHLQGRKLCNISVNYDLRWHYGSGSKRALSAR